MAKRKGLGNPLEAPKTGAEALATAVGAEQPLEPRRGAARAAEGKPRPEVVASFRLTKAQWNAKDGK